MKTLIEYLSDIWKQDENKGVVDSELIKDIDVYIEYKNRFDKRDKELEEELMNKVNDEWNLKSAIKEWIIV